jgi:hypothetical protein
MSRGQLTKRSLMSLRFLGRHHIFVQYSTQFGWVHRRIPPWIFGLAQPSDGGGLNRNSLELRGKQNLLKREVMTGLVTVLTCSPREQLLPFWETTVPSAR